MHRRYNEWIMKMLWAICLSNKKYKRHRFPPRYIKKCCSACKHDINLEFSLSSGKNSNVGSLITHVYAASTNYQRYGVAK